jgi:hypothetical protein
MKKFLFALGLSVLFVVFCFEYADAFRGYDATGGEFLMLIFPTLILREGLADLIQYVRNKKILN